MMFTQYSFHRTSDLINGGLEPREIAQRFANMGDGWWCCITPMPVSP